MTKTLKIEKTQEDVRSALLNVLSDLREANAKNEAILSSIADGVIVVDKNGLITLMNHSAEKLLGWKIKEALGKKWFEVLKREDEQGNPVPSEKGAIGNAITGGTILPSLSNSYYYVRKDKIKFPVARTVSPIIIKGKIVGAVNVFRDVTYEKEIDKMKDEFMDIAAHDLRTPAAAIRGFISRVLDGDAGKISEKARDLLTEAYKGNIRMINLVDDFLIVSRFERGKIVIKLKTGDLSKTIDVSVNEFIGFAKEKGLSLNYKKLKLPPVLFDEDKIMRVVNNLLENAIKFTDHGGVTIWHTIKEGEVVTHVTDTGIGIPKKAQKLLFNKYYKVSEGVSISGLGLGLYICRLYVEGSNGKIWVKSEEGKGSTFSFTLPIAK